MKSFLDLLSPRANSRRDTLSGGTLISERLGAAERRQKLLQVAAALPTVLRDAGHEPQLILPRFTSDGNPHVGWTVDERWLTWVSKERESGATTLYSPHTYTEGRALYIPATGPGLTYCRTKQTDDRVNRFTIPPWPDMPGHLVEPRFIELYIRLFEDRARTRNQPENSILGDMPEYDGRAVAALLGRFVRSYTILPQLAQAIQ